MRGKTIGLIASLALTAALALGVVWALRSSGSGGEGASAPRGTPTAPVTGLPTTSAAPLATPEPMATPSASPRPLPSPADGYKWYVTPPNDFGLPLYAVQVPEGWSLPGPFYGKFVSAPEGATFPPGPVLVIQVTGARVAEETRTEHPFYWELPWQGGALCGVLPDGQYVSKSYTWDLFNFTCPTEESAICEAVDQSMITCRSEDLTAPVPTFGGRAAELRVGDFFFSILAFQPAGSTAVDAAFRKAMDSFTLQ